MERTRVTIIPLIMLLLMIPLNGYGGSAEEFLILQNMGGYQNMGKGGGAGSGILAATGHFNKDHEDESYSTMYYNDSNEVGLDVQVTQHTGGDSDQWLLHEVERGFRRGDYEEEMTTLRFRDINGNNIFYSGLGGGTYRWLSNNVLVSIQYTDLYKEKAEPMEVVNAYLAKYPSTIIELTIDQTHNEQWIKDEISRRLWLCDKWFSWQAGGNVEMPEALKNVVKHLGYFLEYRQRYFSMSADQDRIDLTAAQRNNDDTAIMAKLTEYKQWWEGHKGDSISLP